MQTFRKWVTHLWGFPGVLLLIVPIFFFPTTKYEWLSLLQFNEGHEALLCLVFISVCFIFARGMGVLTKLFFYRDRPIPMEKDTFRKRLNAGTFPSLHTITVTIVAMVVFQGVITFGFSAYIFLLYMVVVMAVALSRIALKKHYPTDVFFGIIYGVVGVFVVIYGSVFLLSAFFRIFNLDVY